MEEFHRLWLLPAHLCRNADTSFISRFLLPISARIIVEQGQGYLTNKLSLKKKCSHKSISSCTSCPTKHSFGQQNIYKLYAISFVTLACWNNRHILHMYFIEYRIFQVGRNPEVSSSPAPGSRQNYPNNSKRPNNFSKEIIKKFC